MRSVRFGLLFLLFLPAISGWAQSATTSQTSPTQPANDPQAVAVVCRPRSPHRCSQAGRPAVYGQVQIDLSRRTRFVPNPARENEKKRCASPAAPYYGLSTADVSGKTRLFVRIHMHVLEYICMPDRECCFVLLGTFQPRVASRAWARNPFGNDYGLTGYKTDV